MKTLSCPSPRSTARDNCYMSSETPFFFFSSFFLFYILKITLYFNSYLFLLLFFLSFFIKILFIFNSIIQLQFIIYTFFGLYIFDVLIQILTLFIFYFFSRPVYKKFSYFQFSHLMIICHVLFFSI